MGISQVNQIVKEKPSTFFLSPTEFEEKVSDKGLPFDILWNDIYPPRALEKSKTTKCTTKLYGTRVFHSRLFKIEKAQQTSLSKTGGIRM